MTAPHILLEVGDLICEAGKFIQLSFMAAAALDHPRQIAAMQLGIDQAQGRIESAINLRKAPRKAIR